MGKTVRTPKKAKLFLKSLCEFGNVSLAAKAAGLGRQTLYQWRSEDDEFARAWAEAAEIGLAALEDEARRRAFEGWDEPVWHQGLQRGVVRKYSDTLLIFLLKGGMPEKYREKMDRTPSGGSMNLAQPLRVEFVSSPATVLNIAPEEEADCRQDER